MSMSWVSIDDLLASLTERDRLPILILEAKLFLFRTMGDVFSMTL